MTKGYHDSKTPESIRDLWRTPKQIFDYYDRRFNFTTDVAASMENRFCADHRSAKMDGLNSGWGERNWCNPPYSDCSSWVYKAVVECNGKGRLSVLLLPADTSVKWFRQAMEYCTECHLISGRISFINELTGKPVSGNNKGSVVFVFDPNSPIEKAVTMIDRDWMFL